MYQAGQAWTMTKVWHVSSLTAVPLGLNNTHTALRDWLSHTQRSLAAGAL